MARKHTFLETAGLTEEELNKAYVKAKITMTPHDYTLKDRALTITPAPAYSRMSSVFTAGNATERELADRLGLDFRSGIQLKDIKLHYDRINACYTISGYDPSNDYVLPDMFFKNTSFMHKHNDLLINDTAFMDTLKPTVGLRSIVEALLKLQVLLCADDSIVPQLTLSRLEGVGAMPLNDVVNLKFVKDCFKSKHDCPIEYFNMIPNGMLFLESFALGFYSTAPKGSGTLSEPWIKTIYAESLRQNVFCAAMYFCEIYRAFNALDDDAKDAIADKLFSEGRLGYNQFVNLFGKYDAADKRYLADDTLESISKMHANERFAAIQAYVEATLPSKFPKILTWNGTDAESEFIQLDMSGFLIRVFAEMHHYAWQDYRVRHFAALLQECKERGIDLSDMSLPSTASSGSSLAGALLSGMAEDCAGDFGNMSLGTNYEEDDAEPTPSGPSPKGSSTMALETMDNLISGCDARYDITVKDIPNDPGYQAAYNNVLGLIDMITKQLTKQIREIKTYNTGGKISGKSRGKVDPHTMYRYKTDPKIFYDNTYKVKEMDLAFGIILDQSGSMSGEGVENGRIALILLHHVLNALRINHSIVGHTAYGYHTSTIMRYVMFNEDPKHTLRTPYMLANLRAHNGNCDSGALNYMEQYIKRTRNKDKIVLIFSDGEPTECSETELRQQVRKMEKEGIHVIGLGINFENIKLYYPDHANGKNMKEMVDILIEILKRYVLEKKD